MMQRIVEIIKRSDTFLITSHVRLDGDAVGSELALYHVLLRMGKEAVVYNQDRVPWNYRFLPGCDVIVHELPPVEDYDCVVVLDCSELARIGEMAGQVAVAREIINIDHHLSNEGFTDLRITDHRASSTAELLYHLIEELGVHLTKDIAANLYAAILTDTGGFHYANTAAETLIIAGKLVGSGADPQWISENIYENSPLARIRLLGIVLETLAIEMGGAVGSMTVSRQALADTGALPEHTDGFVDYPRSIEGVVISVLYTEVADNIYKVSLRSKGKWDVQRVARTFGGGGHLNAASCRIEGSLADVRQHVIEVIGAVMCKK